MNIAIFQCFRGETECYQLKFCIVKDYEGQSDPYGTLLWDFEGWYAHDRNHNRIYWNKHENISI